MSPDNPMRRSAGKEGRKKAKGVAVGLPDPGSSTTRRRHSPGPGNIRKKPLLAIPSRKILEEMIDEAIVDAYGDAEQAVGLFTMIEEHLTVPFKAEMLGVEVTVARVDMTENDEIVAVCVRGRHRQMVPLLELPLPSPPPEGFEWIEAYRHWARSR